MATNITGDSKQEKQKLSIGNIASAFKNVGSNFKQKFSKTPKVTFGKGMTGTSSPFTSGTDPSKITDSLNETNRIFHGYAQTPTCYFTLIKIRNRKNVANLYDKTYHKYIKFKIDTSIPLCGASILMKLQDHFLAFLRSVSVLYQNF